jgi:hypothetical protein
METAVTYVPAFAFFFLVSLAVAAIFRWETFERKWLYPFNVVVSVTLLSEWSIVWMHQIDPAFIIFAFVVAAGAASFVAAIAPMLRELVRDESAEENLQIH